MECSYGLLKLFLWSVIAVVICLIGIVLLWGESAVFRGCFAVVIWFVGIVGFFLEDGSYYVAWLDCFQVCSSCNLFGLVSFGRCCCSCHLAC